MKQIKLSKTFFVPKNNYERLALKLFIQLVENFPETYFVGGIVRNLFLKKKISDIDISTAAKPEQVKKLLDENAWQYDSSAQNFGVISLTSNRKKLEVTTFRKEVYNKTRYPQVSFTSSLLIDSRRRDFTMNSLYFNPKNHFVVDPYNGLKDLELKQLKAIGDGNKKFREDPLRIVRAVRFQKQYQLHFENSTYQALQNNLDLVKTLSRKNIETEIKKVNSQLIKNFLTKKFL